MAALDLSIDKQLRYYRWLTGALVVVSIGLLWNLWSADRSCPTAPILGLHSWLSGYLAVAFKVMIIAVALLFTGKVKYMEWLLAILLLIGFADDFNRLTPNMYQYCIIAILFGLNRKGLDSDLADSFKIIHGGIYLWTGIVKLSTAFVNQISDFAYTTFHLNQPVGYLKYAILIIPLWEIAIAVSFLTGKKLPLAVKSTFVLHSGIIAFLALSQWNLVMIPYNIFLPIGNLLLFSATTSPAFDGMNFPKPLVQKIAIALFVALPALNVVHYWPDYMSSGMYSCKNLVAYIYIDEKLKKQLPGPVVAKAVFDSPKGQYISITHWLESETGSIPNPERFVYEKMYRQLQSRYECTDSVKLLIE